MVWIISVEGFLVIAVVVFLVLISLGIMIAALFKAIIFYIVVICSLGIMGRLFVSIFGCFDGEKKHLIAIIPIMLNMISLFLTWGIPRSVDRYTAYDNGNAFLWWSLAVIILSVTGFYYALVTDSMFDKTLYNRRVGVMVTSIVFIVFILISFTRIWLIGAKYESYVERGRNGSPISYVVEAEEVSLYKNEKRYKEKNELLGTYPKGTILEVKKQLGGLDYKIIKYGWSLAQSNGITAKEGELYAFWGKFEAPDGKVGYVAVYNDDLKENCLAIYEQPTMAEEYRNSHPAVIAELAEYLYEKIDLFHYKSYVQPVETPI